MNKEESLAEIIGILIGDGYLYGNHRKYLVGIVGDVKKDVEYFDYIQKLFISVFNKKGRIIKQENAIRFILQSKEVFLFLTQEIGFIHGKGKGKNITIPEKFLDEKFISHTIRGIFDTDGSVFTSKKKGCPAYPCIELTTTSINLAYQVKNILTHLGFRVPEVRTFHYKNKNYLPSHKVSLYGQRNASLWLEIIGFSLPRKQKKLLEIKMYGNTGI